MLAHEIIIIDNLPERLVENIVNKSINYALLTICFTHKKMDSSKLEDRIQNISKGKIAEQIFQYFMRQNQLKANFKSCQRPFYLPNKRNFIMDEYEWDIQNNFLRTILKASSQQLENLPALIPDRPSTMYFSDQWQKRLEMKHATSKGLRFVFTFMERPIRNDFIQVKCHPSLTDFFDRIKREFPYQAHKGAPFSETWFWNEISKVDFPSYQLNQKLKMYITAWAGEQHFSQFYHTENCHFDHLIYTRIRNKTLLIHQLPAFYSIFPELRNHMKCGYFYS